MKAHIVAYCQQNLGDDMFVRTLIRRYPHVQFTCTMSPKKNQAFRNEKNLKLPGMLSFFLQCVLSRINCFSSNKYQKKMAKNSDVVIRIGGSIFMESSDDQPKRWEKLHTREFVIGANFGPWKSKTYFSDANIYFSQCCDVCFRDQYSFDLFRSLSQVRKAQDVLFGYPYYPQPKQGSGIGISVIAPEIRPDLKDVAETYYYALAGVCDCLVKRCVPIKLFSFCTSEGDTKAISKILSRTHHRDKIKVESYNGNVDRILAEINECEMIIATRFHAMILGWTLNKKVLPVIYSNKQTNVIRDIGWNGPCWDLRSGKTPSPEDILRACELAEPISNIRALMLNAETQFSALDKLLNS